MGDLSRTLVAALKANSQKIGGGTHPGAMLPHEFAHASGDRVSIDSVLHRGHPVSRVGTPESARRPERSFASRGPERKIGHARQSLEVNAAQRSQAVHGRIQKSA